MNAGIRRLDEIVYRIIEQRRQQPTDRSDPTGAPPGGLRRRRQGNVGSKASRRGDHPARRRPRDDGDLAWALFEIARHPDVDTALAAEVARVLGNERADARGPAQLAHHPQHRQRTLRLYPAGYLTARECIEDVEIGGHRISKGTLVLMSQWEQQRDPAVFEDADEFRPDRWSGGLHKDLERGDFFPFGMGPRMCIGGSFANLELMLLIPMIGQRFRLGRRPESPRPV